MLQSCLFKGYDVQQTPMPAAGARLCEAQEARHPGSKCSHPFNSSAPSVGKHPNTSVWTSPVSAFSLKLPFLFIFSLPSNTCSCYNLIYLLWLKTFSSVSFFCQMWVTVKATRGQYMLTFLNPEEETQSGFSRKFKKCIVFLTFFFTSPLNWLECILHKWAEPVEAVI